jgi:hypothetical protein
MKCCICEKFATLLCDGDNCDRPICCEDSKLLTFYRNCRGHGNWSIFRTHNVKNRRIIEDWYQFSQADWFALWLGMFFSIVSDTFTVQGCQFGLKSKNIPPREWRRR